MSFFGKMKAGLKSVADRVTGGYGEVDVWGVRDPIYPGQTLAAWVTVLAKDELKFSRLVVKLEAVERGQFSGQREEGWQASFSPSKTTLKKEVELCGETVLAAGESKDFAIRIEVPADALASFDGKHLDHEYQLSAVVDIPWGADLKDTEPVQVLAHPAQRLQQAPASVTDPRCNVVLKLLDDTADPGGSINYQLIINPGSQSCGVKNVQMHLRCLEVLEAELTRRSPSQMSDDASPDGPSEPAQVEKRKGPVEVVVGEASYRLMEGKPLTSPELLMNHAPVPETFGHGYWGQNGHCRAIVEAVVHLDSGPPILLHQEFFVTAKAKSPSPNFRWNHNTGTLMMVAGISSPISVKCSEMGWIQLKATVIWVLVTENAELRKQADLPDEVRKAVAGAIRAATMAGLGDSGGQPWYQMLSDPEPVQERMKMLVLANLPAEFSVARVRLDALTLPSEIMEMLRSTGRNPEWFQGAVKLEEWTEAAD
jgi:hypothetical protein